MSTEQQSFIAVNDQICTAGAIVWWRLSSSIPFTSLTDLWREQELDLDLLPNPTTPRTALARACNEFKNQRTLVRPLKGGSWAIVAEMVEGEGDAQFVHYAQKAQVKLEDFPKVISNMEPADTESFMCNLSNWYKQYLLTLSPQDISSWIVDLLNSINAVSLRDRGGIYFVPRTSLETWEKIARVVTEGWGTDQPNRVFSVPALHSEEAVVAILDAVEREAAALAKGIVGEMEEGEKIGKQALLSRKAKLFAMDEKLARYEELLGKKTPVFRDLMRKVGNGVATAILASMKEEGVAG